MLTTQASEVLMSGLVMLDTLHFAFVECSLKVHTAVLSHNACRTWLSHQRLLHSAESSVLVTVGSIINADMEVEL